MHKPPPHAPPPPEINRISPVNVLENSFKKSGKSEKKCQGKSQDFLVLLSRTNPVLDFSRAACCRQGNRLDCELNGRLRASGRLANRMSSESALKRYAGLKFIFHFLSNLPPGIPFPMRLSVLPAPITSSSTRVRFRVAFLLGPFPTGPLV